MTKYNPELNIWQQKTLLWLRKTLYDDGFRRPKFFCDQILVPKHSIPVIFGDKILIAESTYLVADFLGIKVFFLVADFSETKFFLFVGFSEIKSFLVAGLLGDQIFFGHHYLMRPTYGDQMATKDFWSRKEMATKKWTFCYQFFGIRRWKFL